MSRNRPGDWLGGYGPSGSPIREGGPEGSPKKKTMNWKTARDMRSEATAQTKPLPVPDIAAQVEDSTSTEEYLEEEVIEVVEDSSTEEEEIVEVEEEEEVVEYESSDSEFDALPPPIDIPNALKPVHMRTTEGTKKKEDDSDSSTSEDDEEVVKEAPRPSGVPSLRPGVVRGHSFDTDFTDNKGTEKRGGKKPVQSEPEVASKSAPEVTTKKQYDIDSSTSVADEEDVKEAPRPSGVSSLRPGVVRGHSFENDLMDKRGTEKRGGKKPVQPEPAESASKVTANKQCDSDSSTNKADEEDVKEAPRPSGVSSLRPGHLRGHSFDNDLMDKSGTEKRGGKKQVQPKPEVASESEPLEESKKTPAPSRAVASRPAPVVQTNEDDDGDGKKEFGWEKPAWTKSNSLRATGKADRMKEGNLATPITAISQVAIEKKELAFEKPAWTKTPSLKKSEMSDVLQTKGDLAKPITSLPHQKEDGPFQKPDWTAEPNVKPTTKGEILKTEGNLARPITTLPQDIGAKDISWKKPAWTTNMKLRGTKKGEQLKEGQDISRPIGGIRPVDD